MAKHRSHLYEKIWKTVLRIPKGKVATYGGIARECGFPRHARLVGYALHNLPPGSNVPWHRVVNARGRISLSVRSGGYQKQKSLLENEGILFLRGRVSLSTFGWPKQSSN